MALVGIELETIVSEPDALTTRPPPCAVLCNTCIICNHMATEIGTAVFVQYLYIKYRCSDFRNHVVANDT